MLEYGLDGLCGLLKEDAQFVKFLPSAQKVAGGDEINLGFLVKFYPCVLVGELVCVERTFCCDNVEVIGCKDCYFGLQIGDGKCVAIDAAGKPQQPIPWDERCFLNQTTSLCDSDAISLIRSVYTTNNLPIAVFAASDGVDDTYTTDERLYTFYQTLWKMLRDNPDKAVTDLQDFLPKMSEQGSHDDISIAGVIRDPQSVWRRIFSKSKYN